MYAGYIEPRLAPIHASFFDSKPQTHSYHASASATDGAPDPRKSLQYCDGKNGYFMFICRFHLAKGHRYAQNKTFDEYCVYNEKHVVALWMLKVDG